MSIFIVLFSSIFIFMIVVRYLKINRKNSSSESNVRITSDISIAVSDYDVVDECFKATNDCDVTYKTYKISISSHSNIFLLSDEFCYFLASNLASNDEKNSTKCQATSMQDLYPTDLA